MLIVNKYIPLYHLIKNESSSSNESSETDEEISDDGFNKLKTSLSADSPDLSTKELSLLNDADVPEYARAIAKHVRKKKDNFSEFFAARGILKASNQIIHTFLDEDQMDLLDYIIGNSGVISFDELNGKGTKNIYDILCDRLENEGFNRESVRKIMESIAIISPSISGESTGDFEVLLAMVLKNARKSPPSDIIVDGKNLEVKASQGNSYARPSGERAVFKNDQIIKNIDNQFNSVFSSKKSKKKAKIAGEEIKDPGSINYFSKENSSLFNKYLQKYKDKRHSPTDILTVIVDSAAAQFGTSSNGDMTAIANEYSDSFLKCNTNHEDLVRLIGRLQLRAYLEKIKDDYLIVFNTGSGNYVIITKDGFKSDNTLKYGQFGIKQSYRPGAGFQLRRGN